MGAILHLHPLLYSPRLSMELLKVFYIKHIHTSIQYRITSKCGLMLMVARTGYNAERGKAGLGENPRTDTI